MCALTQRCVLSVMGKECLFGCDRQLVGNGVHVSVLFVGCLIAAVHGWFVVALGVPCFVTCGATPGL